MKQLAELLCPASSGTSSADAASAAAATPHSTGNGIKVMQEGKWSRDAYVELQEWAEAEEPIREYWTRGTARSRYSCRDRDRGLEDRLQTGC